MQHLLVATGALATLATVVNGHGHVTLPASTRNGGVFASGGLCTSGQCFWFSNNVEIPGPITLPNKYRSLQLNVTGQPQDVYATAPWRSPGTAPVYGSGCGSAGGGPIEYENGGYPPHGVAQGADGLLQPAQTPEIWTRGSTAKVGWAISANHGGGYMWRLCRNEGGNITEECFQKTPLEFVNDTSWIVYPPKMNPVEDEEHQLRMASDFHELMMGGAASKCVAVDKAQCGEKWTNNCMKCDMSNPKYDCTECCPGCKSVTRLGYTSCQCGNPNPKPPPSPVGPPPPPQAFTNAIITEGTFPAGSQWKRDPVPACYSCDAYETCGTPLPVPKKGENQTLWNNQVDCYGTCDGTTTSKASGYCPAGTAQFPEPLPKISGFGKVVWPWSIVDEVKVPADLEAGHYLLSWRWDCEESTQVWQNCADIAVV